MANTIEFSGLGGPVYAGRSKGERARDLLGLARMDKEPAVVKINIPDDTYSLNSSFFLGLFGPSVVFFKSPDAFLKKYSFNAPDLIVEEIEKGIDRALAEVRPL